MSDVFINQIHIQKACGSDNYCHSNLQMKARFTDENQRPHPTWVPFQSAFMHPAVLMLSLKVMRFRCSEHRRVHVNNRIKLTGIVQTVKTPKSHFFDLSKKYKDKHIQMWHVRTATASHQPCYCLQNPWKHVSMWNLLCVVASLWLLLRTCSIG